MRRRRFFCATESMYRFEWSHCPLCEGSLHSSYTSGPKTVQTLDGVWSLSHQPSQCTNLDCSGFGIPLKSVRWQQFAPKHCSYGYDVIAQIGWQRQTCYQRFSSIHDSLEGRVQISESEVRHLYHERYLPLLACHERQQLETLSNVSADTGLLLSLDGLCPEGGEAQLWLVRELQTGLTLRSGWLSQQDTTSFERFLTPIAALGLRVMGVMSDKQRALPAAVRAVFPDAKHAFCQMHYLKNLAQPVAEEDESMKVALRKTVRSEVGALIRPEKVEATGVLTVTGLVPTPVQAVSDEVFESHVPEEESLSESHVPEEESLSESHVPEEESLSEAHVPEEESLSEAPQSLVEPGLIEQENIVQELQRRVRYLLTLKGRPPFRLAGIEMFEQLSQVKDCLDRLIEHRTETRLVTLRQGLQTALDLVQTDYTQIRQAADWLDQIADILEPDGKPHRSADQVKQELFDTLEAIKSESQQTLRLRQCYQKMNTTSLNYAPGLFHCYDVPGLPRTNNDRESEFRDLNRRLLATTGQKGLVKRILHRQGAWELIPRPDSLELTREAFALVDQDEFDKERKRLRHHRLRFRMHSRSPKRARKQLKQLETRWKRLSAVDSS